MSAEPNSVTIFPVNSMPETGQFVADSQPMFGRNLRIALAMRGGVSLAVWIGGAVAELDLLRRIRWMADGSCQFLWPVAAGTDAALGTSDLLVLDRARAYAAALRERGYDSVEFDALAGASAGGLNSILYSVAQRAGAKLDPVLGVWVQRGAFWDLLRGPGLRSVDAPLAGDGVFAPGVREALHALHDPGPGQVDSHIARHLVVDLSATVIDTQDAGDRMSRSGRGEFHFVGADGTAKAMLSVDDRREHGRAVPARGVPGGSGIDAVDESLARLAYSARSTSSLPAGFEPALIYSSYSPTADNLAAAQPKIDFSWAFHVQRKGFQSPFRAIDGGVTDNIPIDRAFQAVRGLASPVYSDRAIIYLDPAPTAPPISQAPSGYTGPAVSATLGGDRGWARRTDPSSRFLTVIARALGIHANAENADSKVGAIDDFRTALQLSAARRRSQAPMSRSASAPAFVPADELGDYIRYRAVADANFVSTVLQDPAVWQLQTDLPERHSFYALTDLQLAKLAETFAARYDAEIGVEGDRNAAILGGPLAVTDCALSLLSWTRELENAAFHSASANTRIDKLVTRGSSGLNVRETIYRALDIATRERDELLLTALKYVLAFDVDPAEGNPLPVRTDEWLVTSTVDQLLVAPSSTLSSAMAELDEVAGTLAALTNATPSPIADTVWAGFPAAAATTALEVAAFCAASGIPEPIADIKYWEISAATPAADAAEYACAEIENMRLVLESILALPRASDITTSQVERLYAGRDLSPDAKLDGISFGAFAGFLSRDWRRNDWLWGRLDGGAGVLQFLESVDAPRDGLALTDWDTSPADYREAIQSSILREAALGQATAVPSSRPGDVGAASAPFWPRPGANESVETLRARLVMGADSLGNLSPGYRVGMLSRVLHLAVRAIGRWSAGAWTVVLAVLVKPAANLVPVIIDPPRALLVAAILAGVWTVGARAGAGSFASIGVPWWWWAMPVVALVAVAIPLSSAVKARSRWRAVIQKLDDQNSATATAARNRVRPFRTRATVIASVQLAVGIVGMVLVLVANRLWNLSWASTICGLLAGVGFAVIATVRYSSVRQRSAYLVRNTVVSLLSGAVFVFLVAQPVPVLRWLVQAGESIRIPQQQGSWLPLVCAVAALALSFAANWGWQAGFAPEAGSSSPLAVLALAWWLVSGILAGAVGYFACWFALWLTHSPDSRIITAVCAVFALFMAGTAQWYLTQVQLYVPSDATKRR